MEMLRRWWSWSGLARHRASDSERLTQAVFALDLKAVAVALTSPKADPNACILPPLVIQSRTLLQHVVLSERADLVDRLLTGGADPMATTDHTFLPAPHLATLLECRPVLERLMADPRSNFDAPIEDPLVGELSTCRAIAARRGRAFVEWFDRFFSLKEALRPPDGTAEEPPMFIRKPHLDRHRANRRR